MAKHKHKTKKTSAKKSTKQDKSDTKVKKVSKSEYTKPKKKLKVGKVTKATAVVKASGKKSKKVDVEVGGAAAVHTKSRTDKSKMPSILQSKAYQELVHLGDIEARKLNIPRTNLFVGGHVENGISTGLLSLDSVLGGGYAAGRMTILPGKESSGKTTEIVTSIANATDQNVPSIVIDAEASFDAGYADRALARFGYSMRKMQGIYDDTADKWVEFPMVQIKQINNGEQVFRFMKRWMKKLPLIRRDHKNNYWAIAQILNKDGSVRKETAEEYSGLPQMMWYIDSMAALVPEILDADDEKGTIGAQARMFTMQLPGISSLITSRHCVLVGTNQLRDKIGGYGRPGMPTPTTQPGGHALRFYTDVRTGVNSCAPSTAGWAKSEKEYTEEPSIYGGVDRYAFTRFKNLKNKSFVPQREGYARIRFMHDGGSGDGYCESFDVFTYLESTGQASKRGSTLSLDILPSVKNGKIPELPIDAQSKKLNWMDFKRAVELPENKHKLFKHCRTQLKSGYAFDIERERVTNKKVTRMEEDEA